MMLTASVTCAMNQQDKKPNPKKSSVSPQPTTHINRLGDDYFVTPNGKTVPVKEWLQEPDSSFGNTPILYEVNLPNKN